MVWAPRSGRGSWWSQQDAQRCPPVPTSTRLAKGCFFSISARAIPWRPALPLTYKKAPVVFKHRFQTAWPGHLTLPGNYTIPLNPPQPALHRGLDAFISPLHLVREQAQEERSWCPVGKSSFPCAGRKPLLFSGMMSMQERPHTATEPVPRRWQQPARRSIHSPDLMGPGLVPVPQSHAKRADHSYKPGDQEQDELSCQQNDCSNLAFAF